MATEIKLRRGTTAQHASFNGAEGEVTFDTDKHTLIVHNNEGNGTGRQIALLSDVQAVDTLAEILALSNTTGGTKIEVDNTSGGIDLIDNAKIRLGTGDDLEIYHDGSHSHILDKGTGSLSIDSAHFAVRSGATDDTDTTPTEHIRMQVLAGASGSTSFSAGNESSGSLSTGMTNSRLILSPTTGGSVGTQSIFGNLFVRDDHSADAGLSSGNLTVAGNASFKKNVEIDGNELELGTLGDSEFTIKTANAFNIPIKFTSNVIINRNALATNFTVESTNTDSSANLNVTSSGGNATIKVLSTDSDGLSNIEVKGTEGGYIDLGEPSTDDYDLRVEHGVQENGVSRIKSKSALIIETLSGGGDVTIKREGSAKLATSANGIDVTGEVKGDSLDIDGNADISGNLVLGGDLNVTGTTTTVNQTNLDVSDNIIGLNRGASTNSNDSGFIIERGSTGDNAIFAWDESADKFTLGTTTATPSSTGNLSITTGTLVANVEGNLTGNVTGNVSGTAATVTQAAQTAITSVGDLTALNVNGTVTADALTMGDNEKITLGAGGDLEIYSDGATSFIEQPSGATGSDNLVIKGQNVLIKNDAGQELIGTFSDVARLSNQGNIKLVTQVGGVQITGHLKLEDDSGNVTTIQEGASGNITLTLPSSAGTLALTSDITVTADSTTTLTNKSISGEQINSGTIAAARVATLNQDTTGNAATATLAKGAAEVVSSSGTKAHDTVKTYVGKTVIYTASSGDLQIDLPEALEDIAEGEQIHFVNACTHSSGKIVIDYDAAAGDQVIKICTGATVLSIGSDNPHIVQGGVATLIAVSANNYVLFGSGVVDN
tara:strand:- start:2947 stop:5442 length:2496 start_codon:yes stop_codon:yes gene_type:complete